MNDERRIAKRIHFETDASIYYGSNDVTKASLETKDISLAGVFLKTPSKIPTGTDCFLDIAVSGSTSKMHFTVEGTISRQEEEGLGISFTKLNPDGYAHIKNLMTLHAAK